MRLYLANIPTWMFPSNDAGWAVFAGRSSQTEKMIIMPVAWAEEKE